MKPRILILTNGPLCRNPRVVKEATTLGAAGHAVTVLGVRNHAPSVPFDAAILRAAPFHCEMIDVLAPGPQRFRRRLELWLARKLVATLGRQTPRALAHHRDLLARARAFPADLTIVHNEAPHAVGVQLLREGRAVAADFEDWHSEDLLPAARRHRPLELIRRTERALLRRCAHTTTTSHALADALHARHGGRRPEVITNSFPLPPDPRTAPPNDPPHFVWFSQTIGPGRGLEPFFDAWRRMTRPSRVTLIGEAGDYEARLRDTVPEEKRALVRFTAFVPPAELPSLLATHDIGLALEPTAPLNKDLTISNKILQYLGAGLAIIASSTAGQREVLARSPEAGVLIDLGNPAALAAQLDGLLGDRATLAARQRAARRLAADVYCWEREAPRLRSLVEAALGRVVTTA